MTLTLQEVLEELEKRLNPSHNALPQGFLDDDFAVQTGFIKDPAKFKAALCTRRSGKSFGAGLYLVKEALENPGVNCLYIALTGDSARRILWKDVLKVINKKYSLGIKFNETRLTATLPNGSVIYLLGMDANEEERDKALGQKYKLVVIDEAASFRTDLHHLVYGILKPAVADERGTICMIGTPGNRTKTFFHKVTVGKEMGWSVHKWSALDNPYMKEEWLAEIEELKSINPLIVETALFQQHYLGLWVVDPSKLVYKFNAARNVAYALPKLRPDGWTYRLGVDLGSDDASAFVVVAWHDFEPTLFVVHVFKKSGMDITDVANKIRQLSLSYPISKVVIDGSNKQAVEEMRRRHGLALEAADKREKMDFIALFNDEMIQGKVKVLLPAGQELLDEWSALIKKRIVTKNSPAKLVEDPSCENHLSDAMLYIWRFTYTYAAQPEEPEPDYGTKEWADKEADKMYEAELERARKEKEEEDSWG